ncbi:hypothetical protein [Egibacter rhizosphaerae]|uniref:hypothetical protein n=1 Tax=Egibacter rhizosphaerae TaxID=1670831 RepID=UPI0013F17A21|nr:hypothetical protein [Egibacter rhizosphaerae]
MTARTRERFAAAFIAALDAIEAPEAPLLVLAAEPPCAGGLELARVTGADSPGELVQVDQPTADSHRLLGAASRVAWSPTSRGRSSPAWLALGAARDLPVWAAGAARQRARLGAAPSGSASLIRGRGRFRTRWG